jgi:hypothetical protein
VLDLFLAATPSIDAAIVGYSGILNVPTAEIRDDLALSFHWLEGPKSELIMAHETTGSVNRMYVAALPLLPVLEVSGGALSIDGWPDNAFTIIPNGFHRAISLKLRSPGTWPGPAWAVGVIDPFSANAFNGLSSAYGLRNVYVVATQRIGPLALAAGFGQGDRPARGYRQVPFLDGPFGGAVWALPFGFQAMGEWDARALNYGLRWVGPWGISARWGRLGTAYTAGATLTVGL